jgi:hypothetical protein
MGGIGCIVHNNGIRDNDVCCLTSAEKFLLFSMLIEGASAMSRLRSITRRRNASMTRITELHRRRHRILWERQTRPEDNQHATIYRLWAEMLPDVDQADHIPEHRQ